MKISKYTAIIAAVAAAGVFSSCENGENEFPDFEDGVSVYFAKQYPVRTLVMGDDTYSRHLARQRTPLPHLRHHGRCIQRPRHHP